MRLFIAIMLSDEMKTSVINTLHDLKKLGVKGKYSSVQNLHLTLAFIGETKESRGVMEAMQSVDFKPFRLTLSGLGSFGDVLYAGVKGNQGLSRLAKDLRKALDEAGIGYDADEFKPHITLMRGVPAGTAARVSAAAPTGEMMVKKISLMKSQEKDGKMVYTEIFSR